MRIRETLAPFVDDLRAPDRRGVVLAYLGAAFLFLAYIYLGKNEWLTANGFGILDTISTPDKSFTRFLGWFLSCFVFLFAVPATFIALHPRLKLADFGIGLGDRRWALKVAGTFTAVMIIAVLALVLLGSKSFLQYYPMFARGTKAVLGPDFLAWFLVLEVAYLLYFVGWEFFFRGLLLFPLEKRIGSLAAVVGVLPFALVHVGKPVPEALGSIVAAWLLGVLALRARSFWPCALIHFAVAGTMDVAAALAKGYF